MFGDSVVEINLPAAVEWITSLSAVLCMFLGGPSPAVHEEYSLPNWLEVIQRRTPRKIKILMMRVSQLLIVGDLMTSLSRSVVLDSELSAKWLRANRRRA